MVTFHNLVTMVDYHPIDPSTCLSNPTTIPLEETKMKWSVHANVKDFSLKYVALEKVEMIKNRLVGLIYVKNIDFTKTVTVIGTRDGWKTCFEHTCTFQQSIGLLYDLFHFDVDLEGLPLVDQTWEFCIKYETAGQVYWDNNGGSNYLCQLKRVPRRQHRRRYPFLHLQSPELPCLVQ